MSAQKLLAIFYIVAGFALIVVFGSQLLIQIVAIVVGLCMIRHGFVALNRSCFFRADFRSFTNDKNQ